MHINKEVVKPGTQGRYCLCIEDVLAFASQLDTDDLDILCEALIAVVKARRALEQQHGEPHDPSIKVVDPRNDRRLRMKTSVAIPRRLAEIEAELNKAVVAHADAAQRAALASTEETTWLNVVIRLQQELVAAIEFKRTPNNKTQKSRRSSRA